MAGDLRCDVCEGLPVLAMVTLYGPETTSQALCIDHLYSLAKLIVTDYEGEDQAGGSTDTHTAPDADSSDPASGASASEGATTDEPGTNGTQRRVSDDAAPRRSGGRARSAKTTTDAPTNDG